MNKYREIEHKFRVHCTPKSAMEKLIALFGKPFQVGWSNDFYWEARESDFIRLRQNKVGTTDVTITTKHTDKVDATDRKEVNLTVPKKDFKDSMALLTTALGDPAWSFRQHYKLYRAHDGTIISLYRIDADDSLFLEIEGKDIKTVEKWGKRLEHIKKQRINASLWDMFRDGAIA